MNKVRFVVADWGLPSNQAPGVFTLIKDNWDDFGYKTSYSLHYTTDTGEFIEIGHVKVASLGMEKNGSHIKLPRDFSQLPNEFFSLGQGREYYEALMQLPNKAGEQALKALRDVAADKNIYEQIQDEGVFSTSFLRDIPAYTVTMQFRRIIAGQAPLTPYSFSYTRRFDHDNTPPLHLEFNVDYESTPPTNVHVLIGANGVGKSMLLRDFVSAAGGLSSAQGAIRNNTMTAWTLKDDTMPFVNVVHASFSAFDQKHTKPITLIKGLKVHAIGLSVDAGLEEQFIDSLQSCSKGPRRQRWSSAIRTLESADPLLADVAVRDFINLDVLDEDAGFVMKQFGNMSSGHKIVILTITRLVELVEEQSLILLDEPETHLHPPLLSALIRAVSDLAIDRNGVAIIATHSPVVLQEVPKSCVWRLQRSGNDLRAFRLDVESFGESVSTLTSEVFHLDVSRTGYHEVLMEQLARSGGSAGLTLETLNDQLGNEGRFVLDSLAYQQGKDHV